MTPLMKVDCHCRRAQCGCRTPHGDQQYKSPFNRSLSGAVCNVCSTPVPSGCVGLEEEFSIASSQTGHFGLWNLELPDELGGKYRSSNSAHLCQLPEWRVDKC